MVSTGRHHGCESVEEARLLQVLDFAADLQDVLSQPMKLSFTTRSGPMAHVPDFLLYTRSERWLIDVRPGRRIQWEDEIKFAATAEVALALGWRYAAVTGWRPHVVQTIDAFASQRRPLIDNLGLVPHLLEAVAAGPRSFADLADATAVPPVARAFLLHLLWHRRLGIDLRYPLTDRSLLYSLPEGSH